MFVNRKPAFAAPTNTTAFLTTGGLIALQVLSNMEGLWTYTSHFFKESAVAPEVDELLVEEPGELELQRWVMAHLAGQDHALPHGDVQRGRQGGDDGRL